eukprot:Colp12_sorted_trinity150504_noHs@33042
MCAPHVAEQPEASKRRKRGIQDEGCRTDGASSTISIDNFPADVKARDNFMCMVSGLEFTHACHIYPLEWHDSFEASEQTPTINHVTNGLSLEPTLHMLFDNYQVWISYDVNDEAEPYRFRIADPKVKNSY